MNHQKTIEFLKCPFCSNPVIENKVGQTRCPECHAEFDIDDREECIFVNPLRVQLPIEGTVCLLCGLVQSDQTEYCLYCGAKLSTRLQ